MLRRLLVTTYLTAAALCASVEPGQAMPALGAGIVGLVGLFGAGGALAAGTLAGVLARLAIGIGLSFLTRALKKPKDIPQASGTSGRLQASGTVPRSFVLGRAVANHSLVYANTFGVVDKTPNAYLVQVISLSDWPVEGLAELWVNGELTTVDLGGSEEAAGHPVPEFYLGGKNHLWVRFYDGNQVAADSYLTGLFSADPDRPYGTDRIGYGVAYIVVVSLVNRELFTGFPQVKCVLDGILLYDQRDDTTAGGEGLQRYDTWATYEYRRDPITMAYNIMRGIRGDGLWLYGGQTIGEHHLPYSSWAAAANECDVAISLDGGGTEAQFEAGLAVNVDEEPADVIDRLMATCLGRVAEIGSTYKVRAGAPSASIASFTDGDLLTTASGSFKPFPRLRETYNGAAARFTSPDEGWNLADAPLLLNTAYVAADGDRELVAAMDLSPVASVTQVQRLQLATVNANRRFRRHVVPIPPSMLHVEPLDTVTWNSDDNGYVDKLFEVVSGEHLPNLTGGLALLEVDPLDYDWDPYADERPYNPGAIPKVRPPAQAIQGFTAVGLLITNAAGTKRAGVRIEWDEDVDDVDGVQFEVRTVESSPTETVLQDQTDFWDRGAYETTQNLLPETDYEARARYRPASDRQTSWSGWLSFTTPAAPVEEGDLGEWFDDFNADLDTRFNAALSRVRETSETLAGLALAALAEAKVGRDELLTIIAAKSEIGLAAVIDSRLAIANEHEVFAQLILGTAVSTDGLSVDTPEKTRALATAFITTQSRITVTEDGIDVLSTAMLAAEARLDGLEDADDAAAAAFVELEARVTDAEGEITSQASLIAGVSAEVDDVSASGLLSIAAAATQTGADVRIALRARTTVLDAFIEAGLYIEVIGSTSRVAILADQFLVATSLAGTKVAPFSIVAGSPTVITLTGNVIIDGSLIVNGTIITAHLAAHAITQIAYAEAGSVARDTNPKISLAITRTASTDLGVEVSFLLNDGSDDVTPMEVTIELKRGSTVLKTIVYDRNANTGTAGAWEYFAVPFSIFYYDDDNVSGSQTYSVHVTYDSVIDAQLTDFHQMKLTEYKR